jgi:(p)ppGpp synthase/HD superfamily hydrolase
MPNRSASATREKRRNGARLGRRFHRAFLFSARAHARQRKKGTEVPYIAHLMGVSAIVLEAGGDEDMAIAALLHDVVEDCGGKPMLDAVRKYFGKRVAHIVDGCTDAYSYPKPPWKGRKERYLTRLRSADAEVRLVSAADKLYNLRSILADYRQIGDAIWDRFAGGGEGTLWYYRALVGEFRRGKPNRITEELERVLGELERCLDDPKPNGNNRSRKKIWVTRNNRVPGYAAHD